MKMKSISGTLVACGRPISEEDQLLSILACLGPQFEPAVAVLTSRSDSYTVKASSARLLASERRALQEAILPDPPMAANIAMKTKPWHTNYGRSYSNRGGYGAFGQNNSGTRSKGRGRTFHDKPIC